MFVCVCVLICNCVHYYVYEDVCICIGVCARICVRVSMCVCICVFMCEHVRSCVCVSVFVDTPNEEYSAQPTHYILVTDRKYRSCISEIATDRKNRIRRLE